MTDEINEIVSAINVNQVLAAILEMVGQVRVPVEKFLNAKDKELIMEYDEVGPTFVFRLKNGQDE